MPKLADKSCAYVDWLTPPHVVEAVRQYFGGQIGLDPATNPSNPTCARNWCINEGTELPWEAWPSIFVNPPYGRELPKWIEKIGAEAEAGAHIVALLPGQRFETGYWQKHVLSPRLTAICFIRGRLKFLRPDGTPAANNPFGSMLYVFNGDLARARDAFGALGVVAEVKCP